MLFAALFLGIIYDLLFHGVALGISVPLFLAVYYMIAHWQSVALAAQKRRGWILAAPIMALAGCFALFYSPVLGRLNLLLLLVLLLAQGTLWSKLTAPNWYQPGFFHVATGFLGRILGNLGAAFKIIAHRRRRPGQSWWQQPRQRGIVLGILVSIPLFLLIWGLLTMADQVFASYSRQFLELFPKWSYFEFVGRGMVVFLACLFFAALFWTWQEQPRQLQNKMAPQPGLPAFQPGVNATGVAPLSVSSMTPPAPPQQSAYPRHYNPYVVATVLTMLGLLYLAFSAVQFSYLFAGMQLPAGIDYAQYARQGFFQLCIVAALNFVILTIVMPPASLAPGRLRLLINALATFLVGFSVIMLVSAHLRMNLYEAAYGYTFLRLLVHCFMLYLAVVFAIGLLRIWLTRLPFGRAFVGVSLLAFVAINYFNIEGRVADWNLTRYEATEQIDVAYLGELSFSGVPALMQLVASDDAILAYEAAALLRDLHLAAGEDYAPWQSYNWTRHRALDLIAANSVAVQRAWQRFNRFTSESWQSYPTMRWAMQQSLLDDYLRPGMTKDQVTALLGAPLPPAATDWVTPNNFDNYPEMWTYSIAADPAKAGADRELSQAWEYEPVNPDFVVFLLVYFDADGNYQTNEIVTGY
jgi:hypothetical protein